MSDFLNKNKEAKNGIIWAIRGLDGKKLWEIETKSEIFEINCSIDINLDGQFDCLASGRKNTFVAFDPKLGKIFWDSSFKYNINKNWNIYNPLVLPLDLDHDLVHDIVIATGGNPAIPSEVHEREPGIILLISGLSGSLIGKPLISMQNYFNKS